MENKRFRVVLQIRLERVVDAKDEEEAKQIVENIDCQFGGKYVPNSFEHVKQEEVRM